MKIKEFTTFASALLMLTSAVEAKDMSEIKAIITETKTSVSLIENDSESNHIHVKNSRAEVNSQKIFIDFLHGEITEESLRKIYPKIEDCYYAIIFLKHPEIKEVLGNLKIINTDHSAIIAFINGEYGKTDEMTNRINNLFFANQKSVEEFDELFLLMSSIGIISIKDPKMEKFLESLISFFDYLNPEDSTKKPKFLCENGQEKSIYDHITELGQERIESRIEKHNRNSVPLNQREFSDEEIKPFVNLLASEKNIRKSDLRAIFDDLGIRNKINNATIILINDSEIRKLLLSLSQAENISTLTKVIFLDFSDKNIDNLLKDERMEKLLNRLNELISEQSEVKREIVNILCNSYQIEQAKRDEIEENLDNILDINSLKKAFLFYKIGSIFG